MPSNLRPDPTSWLIALAGLVGLVLVGGAATSASATYDEPTYLREASTWWRTGRADEISRMGSPATFIKLQAGPTFLAWTFAGRSDLIDQVVARQAETLPAIRLGSLWIWLTAFAITVGWARRLHGRAASALAAWLFALGPNLIAHGALLTMEMPLVAATAGAFALFWGFLESGRWSSFAASAAVAGVAFSCKFTSALYPFILGLVWTVDRRRRGGRVPPRLVGRVAAGMAGYVAILVAMDLVVTGGSTLRVSGRLAEDHPSVGPWLAPLLSWRLPRDWVGFANQVVRQREGGASYLLGERRATGSWYYYPIALAVKVPLGAWLLIAARSMARAGRGSDRSTLIPLAIVVFLAMAMVGSRRNYGVRYLLPMAPLAIVWASGLATRTGPWRIVVALGLVGQAIAVGSCHPHELTFFNRIGGGTAGGRAILADSNLDWGQGLRSFARIEPRYGPLHLYYFGDVDPKLWGVRSPTTRFNAHPDPDLHPGPLRFATPYVAVSASLQHGPWGPAGLFGRLDRLRPVAMTDDGTIAIYDVRGLADDGQ